MAGKHNINTISKLAGVSTATLSDFMNCTEAIPIGAAKRARIMEVMRQTNYRPSAASSSLRRNSVLPGKAVFLYGNNPEANPFNTGRNPMLGELISILSDELKERLGLALEVRSVADEDSVPSWNETIADADAVVCYGKIDVALLELSTRRNIPLALISDNTEIQSRNLPGPLPPLDCVRWDAASHLEKLLAHVVAKGARRLAFVSSCCVKANNPLLAAAEAEAKIAEFNAFVASDHGLSGTLFNPPLAGKDKSPYYEARNVYNFLRGVDLPPFDAVIGHNDLVAQGVVWALAERGLKPGRDILVGGEGDYVECRDAVPGVTTVSYDKAFLAGHVRDILKRRLADNRPQGARFFAPSYLIARESTERA